MNVSRSVLYGPFPFGLLLELSALAYTPRPTDIPQLPGEAAKCQRVFLFQRLSSRGVPLLPLQRGNQRAADIFFGGGSRTQTFPPDFPPRSLKKCYPRVPSEEITFGFPDVGDCGPGEGKPLF